MSRKLTLGKIAGLGLLASFAITAAPAASAFAATDSSSVASGHAGGPSDQVASGPMTSSASPDSIPTGKSTHFAGYVSQIGGFSLKGHPVTVTSTFVVPKVGCTSTARAIAPAVGVYAGETSRDQATFAAANLFVGCYGGTAHYWPALVFGSTAKNYNQGGSDAHPGDVVVVSAFLSTTKSAVKAVNTTRHITRELTGPGEQFYNSPFVGDDGWFSTSNTLEGVPNFGTLTFTNSLLSGSPFAQAISLARVDRVTSGGTVQITVSGFSNSGRNFATFFKHS